MLWGSGSTGPGASSQSLSQPVERRQLSVALLTRDDPVDDARAAAAPWTRSWASTIANAARRWTSSPVPRPAERSAKTLSMMFDTRVPFIQDSSSGSPASKGWLGWRGN